MKIRNGEFEYGFLMTEADKLMEEIKVAKKESQLPFSANMKAVDRLYKETYAKFGR